MKEFNHPLQMRLSLLSVLICTLCLRSFTAYAEELNADVIIVGAGLSGLSSAYYLKKAGKTALILEMSPHIGGRIRTADYTDKAYAEVGLEEFWESNPALDIMRELNIPLESSYSSFSSFYYQGTLFPYTQADNQTFLQSVLSADEMQAYKQWDKNMFELYQQLEQHPIPQKLLALKDISFADWIEENSGLPQKAQAIVRIETEPEFGTTWREISALDGIAEWRFFSGTGQVPYHVQGGNQRAVEKIADFLGPDGIRVNQQVTNITATETGVEICAIDPGSYQQHIYHSKYVITTVPLFRLNDILFSPPLSADRKQAIQTQAGGAYFTAHLLVDRKASHFWTREGHSILPIITDSNLGVIYEGKTNATGQDIVLNLLINGPFAEAYNFRLGSLDEIQAILLDTFEKQWTGFRSAVKQVFFYRYHPRAIASWPVGRSRFDNLSESLRHPQGRIYFAGDFTEDTHSNGAAQSAKRVVQDILQLEEKN